MASTAVYNVDYGGVIKECIPEAEKMLSISYGTVLHYSQQRHVYEQRPQLLILASTRHSQGKICQLAITDEKDITRLLNDMGVKDVKNINHASLNYTVSGRPVQLHRSTFGGVYKMSLVKPKPEEEKPSQDKPEETRRKYSRPAGKLK